MGKDGIWGIVLIAISIFLIIVEIRTIRRQGKQKRQCTMHTQGQVIDYYYGDLPLPIVEYVVNGAPHRVKGRNSRYQSTIPAITMARAILV